jgi:hypothetical protein
MRGMEKRSNGDPVDRRDLTIDAAAVLPGQRRFFGEGVGL